MSWDPSLSIAKSLTKVLTLCLQIWDSRNQLIFRNANLHHVKILCVVSKFAFEFNLCSTHDKHYLLIVEIFIWIFHSSPFFKLNFDGSVINSRVDAGLIIISPSSSPLITWAKSLGLLQCLGCRSCYFA